MLGRLLAGAAGGAVSAALLVSCVLEAPPPAEPLPCPPLASSPALITRDAPDAGAVLQLEAGRLYPLRELELAPPITRL